MGLVSKAIADKTAEWTAQTALSTCAIIAVGAFAFLSGKMSEVAAFASEHTVAFVILVLASFIAGFIVSAAIGRAVCRRLEGANEVSFAFVAKLEPGMKALMKAVSDGKCVYVESSEYDMKKMESGVFDLMFINEKLRSNMTQLLPTRRLMSVAESYPDALSRVDSLVMEHESKDFISYRYGEGPLRWTWVDTQ